MRRALLVVLGALLGAALGAGVVTMILRSAPPVYSGNVLFVLAADNDRDLDAPARRAELAQKLAEPTYLPRLISAGNLSIDAATDIRETLSIDFSLRSEAVLALSARSGDAQSLADALDAIAQALVNDRNGARVLRLDAKLREIEKLSRQLDEEDASASAVLEDVRLPTWARSKALTLARLDGEVFGLTLRRRLGETITSQMAQTQERLAERIGELERTSGGEPGVLTKHLDAARQLGSIDWKRSHLLRARLDAEQGLVAPPTLRVVQRAQTAAVPLRRERVVWAGVIGGALGALGFFIAGLGRPKAPTPTRDGPTLEANLNVRVIGSLPAALEQFATRNSSALASVQPDHLALASIRSFGTALELVGAGSGRIGPVIAADIDAAGHAGHALANLAVCLADAGRRVLVVDAGVERGVLGDVLVAGTKVSRADKARPHDLPADPPDDGADEAAVPDVAAKDPVQAPRGRIRFVIADQTDAPNEPPVPGAFMQYFDCVLIRTDRADRAARLAQLYDGSRGVLAGHHDVPLRTWHAARKTWRDAGDLDALIGLIHGGHPLHEHRYAKSI